MTQPSPGRNASGSLLVPCFIVFYSGLCVMVLELVASKLVSGYIGMSLYTWTTVIGVILAGISLGNYIGGRLADRYESKRLVASLFALSAAATLSILWLTHLFGTATAGWTGGENIWTFRVLCVVFGAFLLPGTVLGTVSPAIAKWALDHGFATGNTVGTIYSWNTIGSIVGTFLTGFLLLEWFDVITIVYIVSGSLVLMAVLFLPAILLGRGSAVTVMPPSPLGPKGSLKLPVLLVFLSGFAVMVVEVVASRLVAGHIGQSIFTWTSVIGVILAGISMGNYIGGQLSDSFPSRPLVSGLFLISSLLCLAILPTQHIVDNADEAWMGATPWWLRVLSVVFATYFLPATALGTISPAVAKWALDQGYATGKTVGTIYAWNVIGSICGTFAAGFYLIAAFQVSRILAFSALTLAVVAVLMGAGNRFVLQRLIACVWLLATTAVTLLVCLPEEQFEQAVLTLRPARLTSISSNDATLVRSAIERINENSSDAEIESSSGNDPVVAEDLKSLHAFAIEVFADLPTQDPTDPELSAEQTLEEKLQNAELAIDESLEKRLQQLRVWTESVDLEMERRYVESPLRNSIRALRNRLYEIFGETERAQLTRYAKMVSRDEGLNIWDQYFFRNDLEYYDESNYYTIKVDQRTVTSNLIDDFALDDDGKVRVDDNGDPVARDHNIRQLALDALVHGYLDLEDLSYLHYEYEHIYASVSHRLLRQHREIGQDLRVMFLGGGSYTFPRYLSEFYPDIHCDVAEIDPRVELAVRKSMGLNAAHAKTFLLLCDEPSGKKSNFPPPPTVNSLFSHSLWRAPYGPADRFRIYRQKLGLAGAKLWDSKEFKKDDIDYVLDVREDRSTESSIVNNAKELEIPVIDADELEKLLETTSHANVETHIGDARQYIMLNPHVGEYDVIYGDAFNDFSVPAHLTTLEFNKDMAKLLKPDGIFMVNVIDIWTVSKFMGSYMNTLEQVFKHVYLLSTSAGTPNDDRSTFVLLASQVPLELRDLGKREEDIQGLVGTVLEGYFLVPVRTGGKGGKPAEKSTFQGDGKTSRFKLPAGTIEVFVESCQTLNQGDFTARTSQTIEPIDLPKTSSPPGKLSVTYKDESFSIHPNEFNRAVVISDKFVQYDKSRVKLDGSLVVQVTDVEPMPLRRLTVQVAASTKQIEAEPQDATTPIDLPLPTLSVSEDDVVPETDYQIKNGELVLKSPLPEGRFLRVYSWSAPDVLLTDAYSPVDNMLSEVAGTRVD